jgi:hypothetical protein
MLPNGRALVMIICDRCVTRLAVDAARIETLIRRLAIIRRALVGEPDVE